MGGKAELAVLGGKVLTRVHTLSVVGRLGGSATNRSDGVWEGRGVGIVRVIRYKGLHVCSGRKERLIPLARGVKGGMSGRISRNNLGHCKGEEVTLWRGALCLIYTKVLCLWREDLKTVTKLQQEAGRRQGTAWDRSVAAGYQGGCERFGYQGGGEWLWILWAVVNGSGYQGGGYWISRLYVLY